MKTRLPHGPLYLGLFLFAVTVFWVAERYPGAGNLPVTELSGGEAPDSLKQKLRRLLQKRADSAPPSDSRRPDSGLQSDSSAGPDSGLRESGGPAAGAASRAPNPFRLAERPKPRSAAVVRAPAPPPPPRLYRLQGTVGSDVAILTDNQGRRHLLRRGETLDSAEVVEIGPNRVRLRDRAGTFEVTLGP